MPSVLDLPVTRRQHEAPEHWRAVRPGRSGYRLLSVGHDAESENPVGVLAAAHERPPSGDPPAARHCLGHPRRLGRGGNNHVRAVVVDLIVGFPRKIRHEDGGPGADHRGPTERTV